MSELTSHISLGLLPSPFEEQMWPVEHNAAENVPTESQAFRRVCMPRKYKGQVGYSAVKDAFMAMLVGIAPNTPWQPLSCIVIGCIFYGVV